MNEIAIIGIGRWGKNLIREFSKISKLKICMTTGDKKNIVWLKENHPNVIHTTNILDILNDPNIDAVIIATPIKTHYILAKKILESKKHAFVEKPLAKTTPEITKLIKIAKKNERSLFVGHVFLHNEVFKKLKLILKNESIKHAIFEWKKFGTFDEDIFQNLASHDFSLILNLFGIPKKMIITEKIKFITKVDRFSLDLYFNNNIKSQITIDRLSNYKKKTVNIITKNNLYLWDDDELYKFGKKDQIYKKIFKSKKTPLFLECQEFLKCINRKKYSVDSAELAQKISKLISKLN
jgi:predicted dehydrogenase